jgi:hypothetical protein
MAGKLNGLVTSGSIEGHVEHDGQERGKPDAKAKGELWRRDSATARLQSGKYRRGAQLPICPAKENKNYNRH